MGYYPDATPGLGRATYWVMGAVSAVALFASVLVHELSHSVVAISRGLGVQSITLFIFGGVSNIKAEAERPVDELLISAVGPLTSFVLAGAFFFLDRGVDLPEAAAAIVGYLALVNLLLAVFNLLPGFPLDGGRVLRSIVWALSGSLRRATQVASFAGQGLGFLLMLGGVTLVFSGNLFNGLWIAFIGWFLNSAAESSRQQQAMFEDLRGIAVAQLMDPDPPTTSPDLTLRDFVFDHVLRRGQRALLVTDGDRLRGIVSITDARDVPQEQWASTTVERVMTSAPLRTVGPGADLGSALQLLVDGTFNQLPVVDEGRPVGMLSRADILRYLQLHDELQVELRRRRG